MIAALDYRFVALRIERRSHQFDYLQNRQPLEHQVSISLVYPKVTDRDTPEVPDSDVMLPHENGASLSPSLLRARIVPALFSNRGPPLPPTNTRVAITSSKATIVASAQAQHCAIVRHCVGLQNTTHPVRIGRFAVVPIAPDSEMLRAMRLG